MSKVHYWTAYRGDDNVKSRRHILTPYCGVKATANFRNHSMFRYVTCKNCKRVGIDDRMVSDAPRGSRL